MRALTLYTTERIRHRRGPGTSEEGAEDVHATSISG